MTYKDPDKQREAKCSNCGKEVPQTDGKRPRLYCDDACRKRMKRRTAHKLNQMADVINGQIINGHPVIPKGVSSEQHPAPDKALPIGPHGATVLGIDPTETADAGAMPSNYYEKAKQKMTHNVTERMYETHKKRKGMTKPKRGKDIKTFEDLPPDVQHTIDSLSMTAGKICQTVKANRTAIAVNYQNRLHLAGL